MRRWKEAGGTVGMSEWDFLERFDGTSGNDESRAQKSTSTQPDASKLVSNEMSGNMDPQAALLESTMA